MNSKNNFKINGKITKSVTYHDNTLPVIIMIHGFRGTHHGLDLIAKQLPDFHIIIPDLPGFGGTEPFDDAHTLDNYVSWLDLFIQHLQLSNPPILLGHSFGSIVAASFAAKHKNVISKLILVNPIGAPALQGPKAIMTRLALFYYWIGRKLPKQVSTVWLSAKPIVMIMSITMAKTKNKDLRKFIHNQHLTHFSTFANPTVVAEAFRTSVQNTVRDTAANIKTPTLLIAGDIDDITPLNKQQELLQLFPNAKLSIIKNVGHLTHYETPDQIADEIKKFI
ncbi:MAG TPA: alpha/beta hydrolase [Candidatus Saccharibacteria bacterium]|nr:alpha/beta hydrolase [Candidatus Saccharibacteria bacterium]